MNYLSLLILLFVVGCGDSKPDSYTPGDRQAVIDALNERIRACKENPDECR